MAITMSYENNSNAQHKWGSRADSQMYSDNTKDEEEVAVAKTITRTAKEGD